MNEARNTALESTKLSSQAQRLEKSYRMAAVILCVMLLVIFFIQRTGQLNVLLPTDLQWCVVSLILLLLNFRSWCFFSEVVCGANEKLVAFVYLKTLSLVLFVALIIFGKLRAFLIFLALLAAFLFVGLAAFAWLSREKPQGAA